MINEDLDVWEETERTIDLETGVCVLGRDTETHGRNGSSKLGMCWL
jgi:hypothetical protein